MFKFLKRSWRSVYFENFAGVKNSRLIGTPSPYSYSVSNSSKIRLCRLQGKGFLISSDQSRLMLSRNKYVGKKKRNVEEYDDSSDEEDNEEDDSETIKDGKGGETKTYNLKSLRLDLALKTILGLSRKKTEEAFYQNKILINGNRVLKKSQKVEVNQEIDVIKGPDSGSNLMIIGRIQVLSIKLSRDNDFWQLRAYRNKSLKVDKYKDMIKNEDTEEE